MGRHNRRRAWLGAAVLAACLAGCSSNSGSPHGGGPATATATIVGGYRIVGGPAPGINNPLSGTIEIHAANATGTVVTAVKAVAGHFRATVPPGRYVAVGRSARVSGVGCTSGAAKSVRAGATIHLTVQCDVP